MLVFALPDVAQAVYDADLGGMISGENRAHESHHAGDNNCEHVGGPGHFHPEKEKPHSWNLLYSGHQPNRKQTAQDAADYSHGHCFTDIKAENRLPCKSERL